MKRLLLPVTLALALTGCANQQPPTANPFVGPTTVPPPGTNTYSNGAPNSYYPGAPNITFPQTSPTQAAPPVNQQPLPGNGGSQYAPPAGGYNYRSSSRQSLSVPTPARSASRVSPPSFTEPQPTRAAEGTTTLAADLVPEPMDDTTAAARQENPAAIDLAAETLAGRQRVVRTLQPRSQAQAAEAEQVAIPRPALGAAPREPRLLDVAEDAIDIMDLPAASASSASGGTQSKSAAQGFRLVSGAEASGQSSEVATAVGFSKPKTDPPQTRSAAQVSYGHASDYAWIRGKLEYSQIDRQWKLRYIPVEGETDDFGGSVVVSNPSALTGHERGDFVEIAGRLVDREVKKGFAPTYEVSTVATRVEPAQ
ncbi:MAG: hypothetical protein JXB62_05750 [Pirellulales bacterium]|nr:hypothetical protein [Pirellulales bacterium]